MRAWSVSKVGEVGGLVNARARASRCVLALWVLLLPAGSSPSLASQQLSCEPCQIADVVKALNLGVRVLDRLMADPSYAVGPSDLPTTPHTLGLELESLEVFRCGCRLEQLGGGLEGDFFDAYLRGEGEIGGKCTLRGVVGGLRLTQGAVFPMSLHRMLLAPSGGTWVTNSKTGRREFVPGPPDPARIRAARRLVGKVLQECTS